MSFSWWEDDDTVFVEVPLNGTKVSDVHVDQKPYSAQVTLGKAVVLEVSVFDYCKGIYAGKVTSKTSYTLADTVATLQIWKAEQGRAWGKPFKVPGLLTFQLLKQRKSVISSDKLPKKIEVNYEVSNKNKTSSFVPQTGLNEIRLGIQKKQVYGSVLLANPTGITNSMNSGVQRRSRS